MVQSFPSHCEHFFPFGEGMLQSMKHKYICHICFLDYFIKVPKNIRYANTGCFNPHPSGELSDWEKINFPKPGSLCNFFHNINKIYFFITTGNTISKYQETCCKLPGTSWELHRWEVQHLLLITTWANPKLTEPLKHWSGVTQVLPINLNSEPPETKEEPL